MNWQNLSYALVQIAHNFGAVAVVGGPLFAIWPRRRPATAQCGPIEGQRRLIGLVLAGFLVQVVSGVAFGAVSYHWYGQFPDIHGVAVAALGVKVACAVAGVVLTLGYLIWQPAVARAGSEPRLWGVLLALGATALTAAAFLRWFS